MVTISSFMIHLHSNVKIIYLNFQRVRMSYSSEPSSRRILLRPVGHFLKVKGINRKINNFMEPVRLPVQTSQQEIELVDQPKLFKKERRQKVQNLKFNLIQDPRQSQFSYRKYVLLEKILLILTIFYMCLCMIRTQILQRNEIVYGNTGDRQMVVIMDIITLLSILLVFIRSVCHNQLKIDQKKMYCIRHQTGIFADIARFVKIKQNLKIFFGQACILVFHPSFFSWGIKLKSFQIYSNMKVQHDLNDLLCLLSLFRVYLVVRALINITEYSTPRAVRLCNYNRINHDLFYSIKCLLQEHPLWSILAVFLIQVIVLGYGMRLTEGTISRQNPNIGQTGFENYINCFWCVFITMATVGYGDYYPKTFNGRCVAILTAVSGIIVSSLLIVSLSAYLTMLPSEMTSHLTLVRLKHQENLKEEATEALIQTMKLSKQLSIKAKQHETDKIKNIFQKLKQKIDKVKYRSRQIKSLVNNNNILQEMNRLFELLRQNLIELYNRQVSLKDNLMGLSRSKQRILNGIEEYTKLQMV